MRYLTLLLLVTFLSGCEDDNDEDYTPVSYAQQKKYSIKNSFGSFNVTTASHYEYCKQGVASFYGKPFHGRMTAGGVKFDEEQMTAAHPTLPIPSIVKVTRLSTKKSIYVLITDRGPFACNRIIDLSRGAARKLGFEKSGLAKVSVKTLVPHSILINRYWKKIRANKIVHNYILNSLGNIFSLYISCYTKYGNV